MAELPRREYTSAGGVVAHPSGRQVLVLLLSNRPGPDGQAEVRLPKGHIESGESPQEAALREVYEEAGLPGLEIVADLGQQTVEFDSEGYHLCRDERYYLMTLCPGVKPIPPESQFERLWLPWMEALARLTYRAEREWMRRAWDRWKELRLDDVTEQDAHETDDDAQVKE